MFKPTKLALGFPQVIHLLVILPRHGSGQGHEQLFQATTRWLAFCANVLEGNVYLLAYLNDILIVLKQSVVPSWLTESDPNQLCTYTTTKREYGTQHWYHCHSCKMIERVGICVNVCHKDHEISDAKFGSFFCDCGAKEDGMCQALVKRATNTLPLMRLKKRSSSKKEMSQSMDEITRQTRRFFESLQLSLGDDYQEIFNRENRNLCSMQRTSEHWKQWFVVVIQRCSVNIGEQHLIISEEKGKQAMISIEQFDSLLFSKSQHEEHECLQRKSSEEEIHLE